MNIFIVFILIVLAFAAFLVGLILLIAFLAAQSRKRKQEKLLSEISDVEYSALVRYNRGAQQSNLFKVKAFEGSGVLYVKERKLYFEDTLHENPHVFDLATAQIKWVNVNLVNGFLKWFSVEDDNQKYYFNIESGIFIFHLDKSKPKTQDVFNKLVALQNEV